MAVIVFPLSKRVVAVRKAAKKLAECAIYNGGVSIDQILRYQLAQHRQALRRQGLSPLAVKVEMVAFKSAVYQEAAKLQRQWIDDGDVIA